MKYFHFEKWYDLILEVTWVSNKNVWVIQNVLKGDTEDKKYLVCCTPYIMDSPFSINTRQRNVDQNSPELI